MFITQELSVCIFDKKRNTFAVLLIKKKKNLANQSALQPFIPNISPSLLGMVNYSKMSFKGQMCWGEVEVYPTAMGQPDSLTLEQPQWAITVLSVKPGVIRSIFAHPVYRVCSWSHYNITFTSLYRMVLHGCECSSLQKNYNSNTFVY